MNKYGDTVSIVSLVSRYGKDLSKVDLSGCIIDMELVDIRDIILPNDREFFQKIYNKSLRLSVMPEGDYSRYIFDDVGIQSTSFTKNTMLPKDSELFQRIKHKSLFETVVPEGDYRRYNFTGVNCLMAEFTFDSFLPEDSDFLKLIDSGFKGGFKRNYMMGKGGFKLTRNVLENIHRYDLSGLDVNLRGYEDYLTESQLSILRIKYKDEINENVFLPEKGMLKERDNSKEKSINRELLI